MSTFVTLCVAVCLAISLLTLAVAAPVMDLAARVLSHRKIQKKLVRLPRLLFFWRISPFLLAITMTLAFALPSFLVLEPRATREKPEGWLLMLAALAIILLLGVIARVITLMQATRRSKLDWLRRARRLQLSGINIPVYLIEARQPLIAVSGFLRPKIFVAKRALECLAMDELRAALAHETVHARRLDNLKQFILRVTALPRFLPGLASVDLKWQQAAEFAADEGAVRDGASPLDLGSAIVKVGRLTKSSRDKVQFLAACHLIPSASLSAIELRVDHLHQMLDGTKADDRPQMTRLTQPILFTAIVAGYVLVLPSALRAVHQLIEWLVQ